MLTTELTLKALRIAQAAHAGQVRKYTGEAYITHPVAVADTVTALGADEITVAAALLHDVLEDTTVGYADLVKGVGAEVADLVDELTDVFTTAAYPFLNRQARKALETARLTTLTQRAKLVKLADIHHNVATIQAHDPDFAKVYLQEKDAALTALGPDWRAIRLPQYFETQ